MSYPCGIDRAGSRRSNQVLVQAPGLIVWQRRLRIIGFLFGVTGQLQPRSKWFGFGPLYVTHSAMDFVMVVFEYILCALEEDYTVYRWNGEKYEEIDCYSSKGGVTTDCGYKPTMHH